MKKKIFQSLIVCAFLILPIVAAAGIVPENPAPNSGLPGTPSTSLTLEIRAIIQVALAVAGLIAVAFIIYGGFRYITSGGNDEAAEAGKKILTNAIIGLVIIIFSYVIVVVIARALSQNIV